MLTTLDTPNLAQATDEPQLPEMRKQLARTIANASEWFYRAEHCINTRYAWWEGQTRDGRKHGTDKKPAFPWERASDTRIRAVEMVIRENVDLYQTALGRMNIQVTPIKAGDQETAQRMSMLLRWYLSNSMADEADSETERLADLMETFGSAVLGIGWRQERAFEMKTVTIDDLETMARQAGGDQLVAQVAMLLYDPAQRPQARQFVRQSSPMLTDREADQVLTDLMQRGTATFPRPYVAEARPSLMALQTFQDIFFPTNTGRLKRARFIAQRELLTEPELKERVEGVWEWDPDFVDELIEHHKGQMFSGLTPLNILERQREAEGVWGERGAESEDLYEVWHWYQRASLKGVPAIYHTVWHPGCDDYYGKHEVMPYLHGEYPFVEFVRERHAVSILASRGWPELIDTHQQEIKVQRDARIDRASLTTLPPMKVKLRVGQKKHTYGPGVEIPVSNMDDMEPMSFGTPDMTSIEVENAAKLDMCEFTGRVHGDLDPSLAQAAKQARTMRWMRRWTEAGKQMLQLAQQYTPAMTIPRVVGMISKPVEISREAIGGQFDLMLSFDARFANEEFVFSLMERLEKYILPIDTNAIVDRDAIIRYVMAAVDPTLADLAVRDAQTAQQSEIEDEQANLAKMFAGVEPPMKLKGQNFAARAQVLQTAVQGNPRLQQLVQQWPDFGEMLQRRMDFFTQQLTQQQNRTIGVYGTTPSPGSQGGPQIGALGAGAGTPPAAPAMMGGMGR